MKILNFGSLNIDYVYYVSHFVEPGETLTSSDFKRFTGGKGCNQSIALARAGQKVFHAGKLNMNDAWLCDELLESNVDTSLIDLVSTPSGHAVIQVTPSGQIAIILHGGANKLVTSSDVERTFKQFDQGDLLLIQNEISCIPEIMKTAHRKGMRIAFNSAPVNDKIAGYPLELVDYLINCRSEAVELFGEHQPQELAGNLSSMCPNAAVVLYLRSEGAVYKHGQRYISVPGYPVETVDTTAANDTFVGYFLAGIVRGMEIEAALQEACRAASICLTRVGTAGSIPHREELEACP
jgi:ribokinase